MKIAIPTNDGSKVAPHFLRSHKFKVFDIENNKIIRAEIRPAGFSHPFVKHRLNASSGKGYYIHKGICEVIKDCDRVLVNKIRKRQLSILVANKIVVDITKEKDISRAIKDYLNE